MTLPPLLAAEPRISTWLTVHRDGHVDIRSGKVEFGQGIGTALAQVVADELDVALERIRVRAPVTGRSPDAGFTAGSLSVQQAAGALRHASACARRALLEAAAGLLDADPGALTVRDGTVHADGSSRSVTYWELADRVSLEADATASTAVKSDTERGLVGSSAARLDLPAKLAGEPSYVHDLRLPDQLYGRMVRPPSRGASLTALDRSHTLAIDGVRTVLVDGDVVGVVAETEAAAITGAARLRIDSVWSEVEALATATGHPATLAAADCTDEVLVDRDDKAQPLEPVLAAASGYSRPYLAHASIGPSAAVARWSGSRVEVWTHSQGVYPLRTDLERALTGPGEAADPIAVTVHHVEGAGCYGHNGADDAAYDAVLLARTVAPHPVHLVWDREDELGWAPLAPAMTVRLEATMTVGGRLCSWRYDGWGGGHTSRPATLASPALLGYALQAGGEPVPAAADPPWSRGGGTGRNAEPPYAVPRLRVTTHRLDHTPLRTSAMRALGAHLNVFATEMFVDQLAVLVGQDPLEFRLAHLIDPRARAVLETAAAAASWGTPLAGPFAGRGVAFARYKNAGAWCAVVAEVDAEAEVRVRRLVIAVDAGRVINPDGLRNQIEGGAIQATSWTITEQVRHDSRRVTSDTWDDYPILRFSEVPAVEITVLDRPAEPWLGAGETSVGPTAGAIGNAVSAAVGVPVRDLPLTPEHIIAAIEAQAGNDGREP